ncbi:MAG TPA: response regulator [Bryobacteraceae bacterium]|nr:response regulator [Bryobacteraceae bacterium]
MFHILLVEDNPGDVLLIREAVRRSAVSADVIIAYDGEQAIQILTEDRVKVDFIFLDLNLPKYDGLQILEWYRANQGPPVVVLTSSSNPADRDRAMDLAASGYVVKPADLDMFMRVIHTALEHWIPGPQAPAPNDS